MSRPRLHGEQKPQVRHVRSERAVGGVVDPVWDGPPSDQAVGGLEADQPAQGRGDPDRAPSVGRGGYGGEADGQCRARAPARSAGRPLESPWVAGRTEDEVRRITLGRELGKIGLADHDRPGGPEPGRGESVPGGWRIVGKQYGAPGGAHASDVLKIFHQDRDARERAEIVACGNPLVEHQCLSECEIGPEGDDSVQLGVETRDALQRPLDELMG
jgi:hypothetical protein